MWISSEAILWGVHCVVVCTEYFVGLVSCFVIMDLRKYLTKDEIYELVNNYGSDSDVSDSDSEVSNNESESNENSYNDTCEVSNTPNIQHVSHRFSQNILVNICNDQTELYSEGNSDSWCEIDQQPNLPMYEKECGIITLIDNTFAFDCFNVFFGNTLFRLIKKVTNRYASTSIHRLTLQNKVCLLYTSRCV